MVDGLFVLLYLQQLKREREREREIGRRYLLFKDFNNEVELCWSWFKVTSVKDYMSCGFVFFCMMSSSHGNL